ncbi:hypothetical protein [Tomitella gaofuii]|uniref:hypothetical protein n=1 Tax=Tomitella gaofuii TaxID=2760083 RepID=UPI0015F9D92C|nr:hypothetical protein [Tomitella gaofuii]
MDTDLIHSAAEELDRNDYPQAAHELREIATAKAVEAAAAFASAVRARRDAETLREADRILRGSPTVGAPDASRVLLAESDRLLRASEPESEWSPAVGQWAQTVTGAEDLAIPRWVTVVLVLSEVDGDGEVIVGWEGRPGNGGRTFGSVHVSALGPVNPRVWGRDDVVPEHVVVRDRGGALMAGSTARVMPGYAPFTEVLEAGR